MLNKAQYAASIMQQLLANSPLTLAHPYSGPQLEDADHQWISTFMEMLSPVRCLHPQLSQEVTEYLSPNFNSLQLHIFGDDILGDIQLDTTYGDFLVVSATKTPESILYTASKKVTNCNIRTALAEAVRLEIAAYASTHIQVGQFALAVMQVK